MLQAELCFSSADPVVSRRYNWEWGSEGEGRGGGREGTPVVASYTRNGTEEGEVDVSWSREDNIPCRLPN